MMLITAKRTLTLLILTIIVSVACRNTPIPVAVNKLNNSDSTLTTKQIDLIYANTKMFPNGTEVSLAIIENAAVRFYGVRRINDALYPSNNSNKIFEIGSLTKVFTSTILATLVVEGKLALNSTINGYIQLPIKDNTPITFKSLANHTSGLPREPSNMFWGTILHPNDPFKTYNERKLKEYLQHKLSISNDSAPRFQYSNLGAGLLGFVLCKHNGTNYENLLQSYIFSKYGMKNTTTRLDKAKPNMVSGLNENGKETPNWEWDSSALVAAGGILSNATDLSMFTLAHFDKSNKSLELTRTMTFADSTSIPEMKGIGLGWIIFQGPKREKWHWHNGGTHGYKSSMIIDADNNNGIIVLSNVSVKNKYNTNIDQLSFELIKTLE